MRERLIAAEAKGRAQNHEELIGTAALLSMGRHQREQSLVRVEEPSGPDTYLTIVFSLDPTKVPHGRRHRVHHSDEALTGSPLDPPSPRARGMTQSPSRGAARTGCASFGHAAV